VLIEETTMAAHETQSDEPPAESVAESDHAPEPDHGKGGKVAIVKKYANRRLYNTASSSYVTLDELCQMVRDGQEFLVYDAKTGDDITRSVLTQIILEEDAKGRNLMPIGFLRQIIGLYDDNLKTVVPRYLEVSMENFARHQEQMQEYMEETMGRFFPLKQLDMRNPFEDLARQNIAMFQKAASMFNPALDPAGTAEKKAEKAEAAAHESAAEAEALGRQVQDLKAEMATLQRQMNSLQKAEPAKKSR
jgi:polyhydroxyalkanoate synthesis repressor PhaR